MEKQYEYQVWPERKILIRLSFSGAEIFCPGQEEKWQSAPWLNAIRNGSGDFVWYHPISTEEAEQYIAQWTEQPEQ